MSNQLDEMISAMLTCYCKSVQAVIGTLPQRRNKLYKTLTANENAEERNYQNISSCCVNAKI